MKTILSRHTFLTVLISLALCFALPTMINTYTLTVLTIFGLLGLSLGFVWGYGGILCFGQAAFFGLGAYVYAISAINIGESTIPMLLAVCLPALFAAALGAMMFYGRLGDVYLGVMTLVITLILFKFINSTAGSQYVIGKARLGGFNGIPGFQTLNVPGYPDIHIWGDSLYYLCFIVLVLMYLSITWLLQNSFGRIVVGIRENEQRAALMGYNIPALKTAVFAIGGAMAGLAGALFANWAEVVTPNLFSLGQSAEIIIWCIAGGLGTRLGPILGAAGFSYLKFVLGQQSVVNNSLIMGLILVLFVLFLPGGIVPALTGFWKGWLTGKLKTRHRRSVSGRPRRKPGELTESR